MNTTKYRVHHGTGYMSERDAFEIEVGRAFCGMPVLKPSDLKREALLVAMRHHLYNKAMLICEKEGHDWVDNSYGGPESGCVDLECRRCHQSHYQTLY